MSSGMIFDIQHYAVHDGPGIRTLVFFKGCPLRCLWCCNPESQAIGPEPKRTLARCTQCYFCALECPSGAVEKGGDGPRFERRACARCSAWPCVGACPNGALAKVGQVVTADEVMARIMADAAFYRNSGGGATFSGGEPLAQPEFLGELLSRCRSGGVSTAVETCGCVPKQTLLEVEPLVDLFLYDVKVMDPEAHAAYTGQSNDAILANLRSLAQKAPDRVVVRVPLVPGCTDSPENLEAIARLVAGLDVRGVELMPYHELGRDKYAGLGREYPISYEDPDPRPDVGAAVGIFRDRQIPCDVNGG